MLGQHATHRIDSPDKTIGAYPVPLVTTAELHDQRCGRSILAAAGAALRTYCRTVSAEPTPSRSAVFRRCPLGRSLIDQFRDHRDRSTLINDCGDEVLKVFDVEKGLASLV